CKNFFWKTFTSC
nr:Chain C, somatostatin-14 [Homo sapiens]